MKEWLNEVITLNKNNYEVLFAEVVESLNGCNLKDDEVDYRQLFNIILNIFNVTTPSLKDKEVKSFNCLLNLYKFNNSNKFPY